MSEKTKYILVIDDDITALDLVSFLFEERGYHVERAADGLSAIEYVKKVVPDLIIVDLRMPQLDGVATVTQLRGLGVTNTPIIAFTAVDDSDLHQEALDAGCNEVLTKPCPSQRLIRCINRYLLTD
jgi:CheY-like chemotaxis protein